MCILILLCVRLSRFDIITVIIIITIIVVVIIIIIIIIMYKGYMYICQTSQFGHCAAHYANFVYLRQFRHLKDRMPDRHQVRAFMFPVWGFVFAYVPNIYIFLILYDFCLLPA